MFSGLVSKNVDSPFLNAFQKFVKDPEGATRKSENLTEAPDKPPPVLPGKTCHGYWVPNIRSVS